MRGISSISAATILILAAMLSVCSGCKRGPAEGVQQEKPAPKKVTIVIKDFKYDPASVTVNVGDTLEWRNDDTVPHTATAEGKFDSGRILTGGSWQFVANEKGSFDYICTYHPNMKAQVVVR